MTSCASNSPGQWFAAAPGKQVSRSFPTARAYLSGSDSLYPLTFLPLSLMYTVHFSFLNLLARIFLLPRMLSWTWPRLGPPHRLGPSAAFSRGPSLTLSLSLWDSYVTNNRQLVCLPCFLHSNLHKGKVLFFCILRVHSNAQCL